MICPGALRFGQPLRPTTERRRWVDHDHLPVHLLPHPGEASQDQPGVLELGQEPVEVPRTTPPLLTELPRGPLNLSRRSHQVHDGQPDLPLQLSRQAGPKLWPLHLHPTGIHHWAGRSPLLAPAGWDEAPVRIAFQGHFHPPIFTYEIWCRSKSTVCYATTQQNLANFASALITLDLRVLCKTVHIPCGSIEFPYSSISLSLLLYGPITHENKKLSMFQNECRDLISVPSVSMTHPHCGSQARREDSF